jgi:hypothetical protein
LNSGEIERGLLSMHAEQPGGEQKKDQTKENPFNHYR